MQQPYLTRVEQAQFLTENGYPTSPRTLAKLACVGGGPKFVKFGRRPLSTPEWLLEWAESRTSAPVSSTSELKGVA